MKTHLTWRLLVLGCGLFALLTAPGSATATAPPLHILCSTFPIYQITGNVVQGRASVRLELMLPAQLGCPHDYALTPQDMQKLVKADVLVVNGLGMEEFLGAPVKKANPKITVIDSSIGIKETINYSGGDGHEHDSGHVHSKDAHHAGRPFEWAGAFKLKPGLYRWSFAKIDGKYADPTMKMLYLEAVPKDPIGHVAKQAAELFWKNWQSLRSKGRLRPGELHLLHFDADRNTSVFEIKIEKAGTYVFFTEHLPTEFEDKDHFFRTAGGKDVEPVAQEPKLGPVHHHHDEHHKHTHDHRHAGVNPHLFASPRLTAQLALNIAAELSKADPSGAALYFANAQTYAATMNKLADEMATLGKSLKNNRIVQPHGIFDYLARDLGLEIIAVMQAHGQEPSAFEMEQLVKVIREKQPGAIFTEPQYPDMVGQVLSKETGIPLAMLDPVATGPENAPLTYYETVMRQNMKTLESTLGVK